MRTGLQLELELRSTVVRGPGGPDRRCKGAKQFVPKVLGTFRTRKDTLQDTASPIISAGPGAGSTG